MKSIQELRGLRTVVIKTGVVFRVSVGLSGGLEFQNIHDGGQSVVSVLQVCP